MSRFNARFTEDEKEEYEAITLDMLKKGYSDYFIANHLGISDIRKFKTNLIEKGKITLEEIEEARKNKKLEAKRNDKNRQRILAGLKAGESHKEILVDLPFNDRRLYSIKMELISDGEITEEEIEIAREKRGASKRASYKSQVLESLKAGETDSQILAHVDFGRPLLKTLEEELVEEGSITNDEITEARKKINTKRQLILECLRLGKSNREIFTETGISKTGLTKIRNRLIADGEITEEEIESAKKSRKEYLTSQNPEISSPEDPELSIRILDMLCFGVSRNRIVSLTGIDHNTLQLVQNSLISEGKITASKIKEAQIERKKKSKETILRLLRLGYSHKRIESHIKYSNDIYISTLIKELKKDGLITETEIEEAKLNRKKSLVLQGLREGLIIEEIAARNEADELSRVTVQKYRKILIEEGQITEEEIEEAKFNKRERYKKDLVLEGLLKGLTIQQIIDSDDSNELARWTVMRYKKELIEEGLITEEQIEEKRFNREHKKSLVLEGLRQGLTIEEIVARNKSNGLSKMTVIEYRKLLIEESQITEEEINQAKANRKNVNLQNQSDDDSKEFDDKILHLSMLGFRTSQIAAIIGTGITYIQKRKKAIKTKQGLSDDDFKNAEKNSQAEAQKRRRLIYKILDFNSDLEPNLGIIRDHIDYTKANFLLGKVKNSDIRINNQNYSI